MVRAETGFPGRQGVDGAMGAAVQALVNDIELRLAARGIGAPPAAFLLGQQRHVLLDALRRGLLAHVAVIDWTTFARLSRVLCANGSRRYRMRSSVASSRRLAGSCRSARFR